MIISDKPSGNILLYLVDYAVSDEYWYFNNVSNSSKTTKIRFGYIFIS